MTGSVTISKAEYESKKAGLKQSEDEWVRKKQAEVHRIGEADRMQLRRENEVDVNRQLRRESEAALMKYMEGSSGYRGVPQCCRILDRRRDRRPRP